VIIALEQSFDTSSINQSPINEVIAKLNFGVGAYYLCFRFRDEPGTRLPSSEFKRILHCGPLLSADLFEC